MLDNVEKRVMLAYSGGLDTSCILTWLIEQNYTVYCYIANVGQDEDFEAISERAIKCGAKKMFVEDLQREFVKDIIYPAFSANVIYENTYLLGTALARPVIAKRHVQLALENDCTHICHGCTGKGNDQIRFELAYAALAPSLKTVVPWRMPEFLERFEGRNDLLEYATKMKIPITQTRQKPWSCDENLLHCSFEAGILEKPNTTPPDDMWRKTKSIKNALEIPQDISLHFRNGKPCKLEYKVKTSNDDYTYVVNDSLEIIKVLNNLGGEHGIGRIDIVETRFNGIFNRACYETPGGTIIRKAHIDLESITLDKKVRDLQQTVSERLSNLIYNGFWFSHEREVIMKMFEESQKNVNGVAKLQLYKGNVINTGRCSEKSLYDEDLASMDVAGGFVPSDSTGFINILKLQQ